MCNEQTEKDNERYLKKLGVTRRNFGKMGAGAALATMLPPTANAQSVIDQEVIIDTPDGKADAYFVHPAAGAHAAVIIWPDVMSIRPAFRTMGKRLAESGYSVLVVNPYYRTHFGEVISEGESFADPAVREKLQPHRNALSAETTTTDGVAYINWLDQQPAVDSGRKIGVTGYCMTGSFTMRIAAASERIGAGGSFHGGGLVTSSADSPHLLIAETNAGFLIAIAENDDASEPDVKNVLRETFDSNGKEGEVEVYADTMHGWCPLDSRVYNEEQAERAWSRMLALFERKLA